MSSVDMAPNSQRAPHPVTLESLNERLLEIEERIDRRDSDENVVAEDIAKIKQQMRDLGESLKDISGKLDKLANVIGDSPDLSTGNTGTGMRKQLSDLVTRSAVPAIVAYITPALATCYGLYQALRAFGFVK